MASGLQFKMSILHSKGFLDGKAEPQRAGWHRKECNLTTSNQNPRALCLRRAPAGLLLAERSAAPAANAGPRGAERRGSVLAHAAGLAPSMPSCWGEVELREPGLSKKGARESRLLRKL